MDPISVLIGAGVGGALAMAALRKLKPQDGPEVAYHHPAYLEVEQTCEVFVYAKAEQGGATLQKIVLPKGKYTLTQADEPDGGSVPWLVTRYGGRLVGRPGEEWPYEALESGGAYCFYWAR